MPKSELAGGQLMANVLTSTTYGSALKSPFDGAMLVTDGPGDDEFDIMRLKLVDILTADDPDCITMEDAVRRGQANPDWNWGERLAFRLCKAGNAGEIRPEVWPVGLYAIFPKTIWLDRGVRQCAWFVFRLGCGFYCCYGWFVGMVDRNSRFPSLAK